MTVIATDTLIVRMQNTAQPFEIRLHAPEPDPEGGWTCRFEIDWPGAPRHFYGAGVDSMQALVIALQIIGAQLYTSTAHKDGRLSKDDLGEGYGYPVHKCMRDLLVGYDKENL